MMGTPFVNLIDRLYSIDRILRFAVSSRLLTLRDPLRITRKHTENYFGGFAIVSIIEGLTVNFTETIPGERAVSTRLLLTFHAT